MPDYIALSKAAARLEVSADTVARWIDAGKLRGVRVPPYNARVVLAEDVERLAHERQVQTPGRP